MPESWCAACNTRHADDGECPGELLVSEPERHGWRVLVQTGGRTEVYGVLVAPTGDRWRSRILTLPNMLWSVPGGRGTMKFVGATAQEAEGAAIGFIREHCNQRGYSLLGEPALVESGKLDRETEGSSPKERQAVGRRRYLKWLPLRFGTEKPTSDGRTADLSLGGLFIVTEKPLAVGVVLKLRLDLNGFVVPMTGRGAWSLAKQEQGPHRNGDRTHPASDHLPPLRSLAEGPGPSAGNRLALPPVRTVEAS